MSFQIRLLFLSALGLVTNLGQGCSFSRTCHFPVFGQQGLAFRLASYEVCVKPGAGNEVLPGEDPHPFRAAPSLAVGVVLKFTLLNPE